MIMIMINILLLKNLTNEHQKILLLDYNKQTQQAKIILLTLLKKTDFDNKQKTVTSKKNILNELSKKH